MKKSLFLAAAALCGSVMSANAALKLASIEEAAWANLSKTDFSSNNYTGEWGRLKVVGKQLCSEKGNPIQLRGWSTFSINYDEVLPCLNEAGFDAMKTWGANIVRLAIYPKNSKGSYSSGTDATIEKYIGYAAARKMYVLVDWHVLDGDGNSGNPATYKSQAKQMFTNITKWVKTNGYTNVLYEICNECSGVSWDNIKSYASEVLPVIESGDPGAVVVVGTPQWDQNIGDAVNSPISSSSYPNLYLMYAFHFYACSHSYLLGNLQSAAASLPCFISEWGSVRFDGAGSEICSDPSNTFLAALQPGGNNGNQLISWCYWAWGQKNEASNCLTNCSGGYTASSLTASGNYIVPILTGETSIPDPPQPEYYATQDIPVTGQQYGTVNIGWFDYGGEGVAYHDANSSKYSDDEKTVENPSGTEYTCCNAGAVYSGISDLTTCFRYDECVDVSNSTAGLGANWGEPGDGLGNSGSDLHNICMSEHGEWMLYHINVQKAGYYTVKCMTNNSTSSKGSIGMAIAKGTQAGQNGNIIRSWADHNDEDALAENAWTSFALNPTPSCGLMYDGTINADGASGGDKSQDWTCWGWTDCGATASDKSDLTVLFKYTGEQELQISISPDTEDSPGDFSNFAFTFKSADIPDFEFTEKEIANDPEGVEATAADLNNVYLYPNPSSSEFTVKVNGAANVAIFNAIGAQVYNKNVEGDVVVNGLESGVYTVRVATAAGVKSLKMVVKK